MTQINTVKEPLWIPDITFFTTVNGKEYMVEASDFGEERSTGTPFGPDMFWVTRDGEDAEGELTQAEINKMIDESIKRYGEFYPDSD